MSFVIFNVHVIQNHVGFFNEIFNNRKWLIGV